MSFDFLGEFELRPGDGTLKSPTSRYPSTSPLSQKCQENSWELNYRRRSPYGYPHFGDFYDFCDLVVLCPGGSELHPWRSQEVKGSLELQNGGLRALEEAFG